MNLLVRHIKLPVRTRQNMLRLIIVLVSLYQAPNTAPLFHEPSNLDEESSKGGQAHPNDHQRSLIGCRQVLDLEAERALSTTFSSSQYRVLE